LPDFGTYLDLLGLNAAGDLVIIELKRDQTLRETVAQGLEYAAWASTLSYEQVADIAKGYLGSEDKLREAFRLRFEADLPDALNQAQKIVLIAPEVTEATRIVVEYLAESYAVPINAVSVSLTQIGQQKVLMRQAVLPEDEARSSTTSKRRAAPTIEQFLNMARANGSGEIAEYLWSLHPHFLAPQRYQQGWGYRKKAGTRYLSVFAVFPALTPGAVVISMFDQNLATIFGKTVEECRAFLNRLATEIGQRSPRLWDEWERFSLKSLDAAYSFVRELGSFTGMAFKSNNSTERL
jgi:hypothetical protein